MPAYSGLSLLLAVTALSWQTKLKYGYELPASENPHPSKSKLKTYVAASSETSLFVGFKRLIPD